MIEMIAKVVIMF